MQFGTFLDHCMEQVFSTTLLLYLSHLLINFSYDWNELIG